MDITIIYNTKYLLIAPFLFRIIIIAALIFVPMRMFAMYQNRVHVNTSYMLPASTNEKFFVPFIISLVFVPIILYILYIIVFSLTWVLSLAINSDTAEYAAIVFNKETFFIESPISYLAGFIFYHSFGLLLSNTKNVKFIIPVVVSLIISIVLDYTVYGHLISLVNSEIIKYSIDGILAILFWIVSYINFKKIETTK